MTTRIGASGLLTDIERQLFHWVTGRYGLMMMVVMMTIMMMMGIMTMMTVMMLVVGMMMMMRMMIMPRTMIMIMIRCLVLRTVQSHQS